MTEQIDIRPLKERAFALTDPSLRTLREVLISQPDTMSKEEFLAKAGDWLRLMEIKETR
jgi:hypothetical protein